MKKYSLILITLILSWSLNSSASLIHRINNSHTISDHNTVQEAVNSIKLTLEQQGNEIIGVIDHAANAERVGLELADNQLILFRDQNLENRLLKKNTVAAIDLPIKILVYEDPDTNKIKLLYNPAGYLADRHLLITRDRFLSHLNHKVRQFGQLDNGLINIESSLSKNETVAKIQDVLASNGFLIPFTFDFKTKRYYTPKESATLIIFGNPAIGTQLMQNRQAIGLDLPLKFLVWEDIDGQTIITYNKPQFLGKRHGIQGLDVLLGNIANRLNQLANAGAGHE